jgi:hypothetical protein
MLILSSWLWKILYYVSVYFNSKLIIRATIIESLRKSFQVNVGIAYEFFDSQFNKRQQFAEMTIRYLLKQFVCWLGKIPKDLENTYKKSLIGRTKTTLSQKVFAQLLADCMREVSTTFILLDGYDQLPRQEGKKLLAELLKLSGPGLQIYVTTRDDSLSDLLDSVHLPVETLEIEAHDADIKSFLKSRLRTDVLLIRKNYIADTNARTRGLYVSFLYLSPSEGFCLLRCNATTSLISRKPED